MENVEIFPPLAKPLDRIAANLAHEGVPVMAIARALTCPFAQVLETLEYFLEIGGITEIPRVDWPPTQARSDRLPAFFAKENEKDQLTAIQRALKVTRLEASFIRVLLCRDEVDKDTLHYVIESQRALRRSRPDNPEATDPKMVDVVICHLRKKVKQYGIQIKTLWGVGYFLDEGSRTTIEEALEESSGGSSDQ